MSHLQVRLHFVFFLPFSWAKFIQNAKFGGVLKNSGYLLHDRHKNFENLFRITWDIRGQRWHPSFRNWHFTISQRQKNNFGVTCANFDLKYLCYFKIDFCNVANFLNLLKLTKLLYFGRIEADKIAKSKVGPILWDTLYSCHLLSLQLNFQASAYSCSVLIPCDGSHCS